MYQSRFTEPQKQGLHRHTGSNAGLFYCNERQETVSDPDTKEEHTEYIYDTYEVADARDPHKVKNDILTAEHPFGDETKILRKTLARMLKADGSYDSPDFAEFRAYNEFAESV